MLSQFKPAALILLWLTLITGVAYPVLVTVLGQSLFSEQANGSLIRDSKGQVIGSRLIGQTFSEAGYFWGRPSATSPYAYNAGASSGSNLGPTNPALKTAIEERVAALKQADPANQAEVPIDLVTASGSGLDPHISLAAAEYQAARIAKARHIAVEQVRNVIVEQMQGRQLGLLGEPRVNVLQMNLALDQLKAR
jgi:potassium-transporting ATPase KdpC subunit